MLEVVERPLTDRERKQLRERARVTADDIAWILAPTIVTASLGFFLSVAFVWIAGAMGLSLGAKTKMTGTIVGGLLGTVGSVFQYRGFRNGRGMLTEELRNGKAEDIHVTSALWAAIEGPGLEDPAFIVDAGGQKLLFLCGKWMWDPHEFAAEGASAEDSLEPNDKFPSNDFILTSLPRSGIVLNVNIEGVRVEPEITISPSRVLIDRGGDCVLFTGSFEAIRRGETVHVR